MRFRCERSTPIRKLSLPEQPMLMVEFHGTEASVAEQARRFGDIAAEHGAGPFASATRPEERNKLWQARHDTYWAQMTLRPGARPFATDACVPISRLADCVDETLADIERSGLVAPIVGHVGDGNFHVSRSSIWRTRPRSTRRKASPPASPIAPSLWAAPAPASTASARRSANIWTRSTARSALDLMRRVKASFDPENLFNPGKVFYA